MKAESSTEFERFPGATYRFQFNRAFTFAQATELLDYLQQLGITDVYASPLLQAGPDSTHGYDICCFGTLNPNLGSQQDFETFHRKRKELGLGLLLDMVPNHMGAVLSNAWWLDVLEHGSQSRYAEFFDINWNPSNLALKNKVLIPTLGDHYSAVLERGELKLDFADGRFWISYFDRRFPVNQSTVPEELKHATTSASATDAVLSKFNGTPGNARSFDRLHSLIQKQHYRLAFWKVGSEEINYRRFFDVTELVSLRMERAEVFEESHRIIFDWIRAGNVTGLRIDHPDGLRDPKQYFECLQEKSKAVTGDRLYVVAEKILSGDEQLPIDWPVDGTTGYDFLNRLNGLFVDTKAVERMDGIYAEFCGGSEKSSSESFQDLVLQSKQRILETSLISEMESLTHRLQSVATNTRAGLDFTQAQLKAALKEVIAAFPVYRTYITDDTLQPSAEDKAVIEKAISDARGGHSQTERTLFDFLSRLLTLELLPEMNPDTVKLAREFIARFQQLTGPVMAKGLEDTAFYNFNRLISLNEVGGEPARFGWSAEEFHNANARTHERWPHTLLATATHDTKRGEDARARINVLSELPEEWHQAVIRWSDWNSAKKTPFNKSPVPTCNDEYLIYQSLVGALPQDSDRKEVLDDFRDRFVAFLLKAIREAKANTSWLQPDSAYEDAVQNFAKAILADSTDNNFLPDLRRFSSRIAFFGRINSLAQTALKIVSPGVPDFYQGAELLDFSFVDPDNRRPVDYILRRRLLSELQSRSQEALPTIDNSGVAKLFVVWRGLQLRRELRGVFDSGDYIPLSSFGGNANHLCAFARSNAAGAVVVIVPRLTAVLMQGIEALPLGETVWKDTALPLNSRLPAEFENVLTGKKLSAVEKDGVRSIRVAEALAEFPVAILKHSRSKA